MSFDSMWLKKCFKLPLKMAIKEIISKKPYDPIGYLGFWLLDYKKFQERNQWQLEKDNELYYLRSLIKEEVYFLYLFSDFYIIFYFIFYYFFNLYLGIFRYI